MLYSYMTNKHISFKHNLAHFTPRFTTAKAALVVMLGEGNERLLKLANGFTDYFNPITTGGGGGAQSARGNVKML